MELEVAKKIIGYAKENGIKVNDETDILAEAESILIDAFNAEEAGEGDARTEFLVKEFFWNNDSQDTRTIVQKERLPIPSYISVEEVPDMPFDLTAIGDVDLRRLHSKFNAFLSRTNWLVCQQENVVEANKLDFKKAYGTAILDINPFYETEGRALKEKKVAVVEAETYQNSNVIELKKQLFDSEKDLRELKILRDIYENNCVRISREWTMREEERKHSGGL